MKTVTVSIDEETYRRAEAKAAARNTSVEDLITELLNGLRETPERDWTKPAPPEEFERLKRLGEEVRAQIVGFSASDRLPRDELYDRSRWR
ncbi:hypothetical protein [Phreatobacter oligotrophus]|uniref:Uncharacterized protein n=1 Tax=Phreatobacter oligotrophus TaxID=1122261 RepID=A0A2T4ZG45_9HYPH|nr:hypothetical protein [Phreatobacter oligotrophus]PTM60873.1 hypothetical protein C8P69_102257 [Phreatobacter oligotrophus]